MSLLSFVEPEEWTALEHAFHEMQPCTFVAGHPQRFGPLWSDWEFDAVCRFVPLPDPADFRLVRAGKPLPSAMYRDRTGTVNREAVSKLWSAGTSMVLVGIDSYSDRLLALGRFLEASLQCPVQMNLYATPGGSQAFGEHIDRHDVLVLQVSGEKIWDIATPQSVGGTGSTSVNGRERVVLRSGSWLYVPKGVPHEVRNQGTEPSVHITVGFYPLSWSEVIQDGLERARLTARPLMERIPFGAMKAEPAAQIGARLAALLAHLDVAASRQTYFAQFPRLAVPVEPLATRAQIESADTQTRFAWQRSDVTVSRDHGQLQLHRSHRRFPLSLHVAWEPVVRRMSAAETFTIAELASDDQDALLPFCRLLANTGILALPPPLL